ncbi:uncharacterized protein LOC132031531 [Lycium ferocissimum]|uniref:uncharacterized protein LOC132031531 n=1 Tax=Lycium ferocissimum TaxID=112874 RepID=UPI002815A56A|nr:uncharacterized protein LOC132031531 [Lycium ferocissimum]
MSSAAFCIRNDRGDLMYAAARTLNDTTNICAEAIAIGDGIEYCVTHQFLPVIMETDSLALLNIIRQIWSIPWNIRMEIRRIQYWSNKGQVQFAHILREGNALADCLANCVLKFAGNQIEVLSQFAHHCSSSNIK